MNIVFDIEVFLIKIVFDINEGSTGLGCSLVRSNS